MEQSETDDDEEVLDNMFIMHNYGHGQNDEKHVKNMLKRFEDDGG